MIPFFVLMVSFVVLRALGALGVEPFESWQVSASWALAAMLVLTASAHFGRSKFDLMEMVPKVFPRPDLLVAATGVLELLGALGLVIPSTRALAGICLALLMAAMFLANADAAKRGVKLRGRPPTPLIARVPMQVIFICFALWAAL